MDFLDTFCKALGTHSTLVLRCFDVDNQLNSYNDFALKTHIISNFDLIFVHVVKYIFVRK